MNRNLLAFAAGLALGVAVTADAHFRVTGDEHNTREAAVPAAFAIPRLTSLNGDETPGTIGYMQPGDGSQPCEGRIVVVEAAGPRCIVTEAP